MDEDYGKKVGQAIQAVQQLHLDIGRLFRELDSKEYKGWDPVFKSYVTKNVSKDVKKARWMPKVVYRYYCKTANPAIVEGVTCCFFAAEVVLEEPEFVVSQLHYRTRNGHVNKCREWDVWNFFIKKRVHLQPGQVFAFEGQEEDRFQSARLLRVTLYSIQNREMVTDLIERVRQEPN
jgi:hypothetical protein